MRSTTSCSGPASRVGQRFVLNRSSTRASSSRKIRRLQSPSAVRATSFFVPAIRPTQVDSAARRFALAIRNSASSTTSSSTGSSDSTSTIMRLPGSISMRCSSSSSARMPPAIAYLVMPAVSLPFAS